jgi:hypothetical protein
MKIRFSHENGIFVDEKDIVLTEAFAEIENETYRYMFENGWLPHFNGWYQCCSCRLELDYISARRKREVKQIKISEPQNIDKYIDNAGKFKDETSLFFSTKKLSFYHG